MATIHYSLYIIICYIFISFAFCCFVVLYIYCFFVEAFFFLISFCAAKWNLIIKILSITLKKTNWTTKSVCKNNKNYINSQWEISDNTRSQLALSQFRSFNIALFNSRSLSLSLTLVLVLAFTEGYQALSLSLLISLTLYGYSLSRCLSATTAVDRTQLHWHSRWGRVATPRKMQGKWTVASSCDFRVRAACVDGKTAGVKYNQKKNMNRATTKQQ